MLRRQLLLLLLGVTVALLARGPVRAQAHVRLQPQIAFSQAREWRSLRTHTAPGPIDVEIGPGAVEFVEFQ